jgi:WD40 repeat protein
VTEPCPPPESWELFLAEHLGAEEQAALDRHLGACPRCQAELQRLSQTPEDERWRALATPDVSAPVDPVLGDVATERFLSAEPASVGQEADPANPAARLASCPTAINLSAPAAAPEVPGYAIVKELGRGGMGVVYLARQVALGRLVALKVVRDGAHADADERQRFLAEAAALAALQHPHIVQIYECGQHGGLPYFALEYCPGGTLSARLATAPQTPRQAALWAETLAGAVDAAHRLGIVHRDLKPGNVLLTADGQLKVTDFGLAKRLTADPSQGPQTASNVIMGTPNYLAPEQAAGKSKDVSPAADTYALGAILYELLTGRPPFQAPTPLETLVQVVHTDAPSVRLLQPQVPRDLETICHTCLAKDPHKRYASAAALAEDLRCFLDGRPILARPAGPLERTWKWARRRPLHAALAATVLVSLLAVSGLLLRAESLASAERAARREADRQRLAALRGQAEATLDRGLVQCDRGEVAEGLLLLARSLELAEQAGAADLEPAIRANLAAWRALLLAPRASARQGTPLLAVAVRPDGRAVLTASWAFKWNQPTAPAEAQLWDAAAWKPLGPPCLDPAPLRCAAFRPDGRVFVTGGEGGIARLWDADGGPARAELRHDGPVLTAVFSADGRTLLTGGVVRPPGAADPDPPRGTARLWDAATGQPKGDWLNFSHPVTAVAFEPDGGAYWTASGREARRWHTDGSRSAGEPIPHADPVLALAVSPDGRMLATGGADQTLRLFDTRTGKRLTEPLWHAHPVWAVAFSPDGQLLATGGGAPGRPGSVQLWDPATGQPVGLPLPHTNLVHAVTFHPAGHTLFTVEEDGQARAWALPAGQHGALLLLRPAGSLGVLAAPGGDRLVTREGGALHIWERSGEGPLRPVEGPHPELNKGVFLSPDGRTLATPEGTDVVLRSAADGRPVGIVLRHPAEVHWAAFHPRGSLLATGTVTPDGRVRLWDTTSGRQVGPEIPIGRMVNQIGFNEDGSRLFTSGLAFTENNLVAQDIEVRLWETATGRPVGKPLRHAFGALGNGMAGYAGGRVVTASDVDVRFWDAEMGAALGPPLGVAALQMSLSPDGGLTLVGGMDGTVRLFDSATHKPVGRPWRHAGPVELLNVQPDGRSAVTVVPRDGTVRRWDLPRPVSGTPERVGLWVQAVTGMHLDAAGTPVPLGTDELRQVRDRLRTLGGPPVAEAPSP